MPDGTCRIKKGEKRPIYGAASVNSGTLTISGQPTCTLTDSTGTVVTGLSAVNVTGYDAGAVASFNVWYDLDTLSPTVLAAGWYTLVFKVSALGSDGIARVLEPSVSVQVIDPGE